MLTRYHTSEIRYLAREVLLLYKAKSVRPNDQADFERVAPKLDTADRSWLCDSLAKTAPGHSWLTYWRNLIQLVPDTACTRRRSLGCEAPRVMRCR